MPRVRHTPKSDQVSDKEAATPSKKEDPRESLCNQLQQMEAATPKKKETVNTRENLCYQRQQISRKVNVINRHLEEAEDEPQKINPSLLKVFAKKLELHYKEFTDIHREIQTLTVSSDIEEEEEKLDQFDALHTNTLALLEQLTDIFSPAMNSRTENSNQTVIVQQPIRAPVPTFDGRVENWPKFRTMFEDIFARSGDSDAVKLHHLDKALIDDAAGWITAKIITDNNFQQTWQQLIDQYENPRVIVDTHLDGLLDLKPITKRNFKDLLELVKSFNRHVGGLEYQGLKVDELSGLILVKILTSRLDSQTLQLWERNQQHAKLPNIQDTVSFLRSECQVLERFQNRFQVTSKEAQSKQYTSFRPSNQKSYTATAATSVGSCEICNESHRHFECPEFHKLSPIQRNAKVKELKICFNCLRPGHRSLECSSKKTCARCHRKHHTLLHQESSTTEDHSFSHKMEEQPCSSTPEKFTVCEPVTNTVVSCNCHRATTTVMLMTAMVRVRDNCGYTTPCRVLLDSGSQVNFISKSLIDRLSVTRRPVYKPIAGIGGTKTYAKETVMVEVESMHSDYSTNFECLVVPNITGSIPATHIQVSSWPIDNSIPIADPNFNNPAPIDMLIGVSQFLQLLKTGRVQLGNNLPELIETHLGWVVAGSIDDGDSQHCLAVANDSISEVLRQFWELEEIHEASQSTEQEECEKIFQTTHYRDITGRYVVSLPLRESIQDIGNNRTLAMRRFLSLERRLARNPELKQQYQQFIKEYESMGHCREIKESNCSLDKGTYYIPHQAILRPSSSTTKLRVVFDASSKASPSDKSLNDVLQVGGILQSDIFSILLRFRKHRFVFTADISKMYRQIRINPNQTRLQRIFWRSHQDDPLRILELTTVTYGTAAAPFLATRCLMQLCEDENDSFPLGAQIVRQDCYVDDVISGANSINEALVTRNQIRGLLMKGGFPVHKWSSNSAEILNDIPEPDREKLVHLDNTSVVINTLGMIWSPEQDVFVFSVNSDNRNPTKRSVLSDIGKLFDPLGLLTPVTVFAKMIMQKIWKFGLPWDAPLENELLESWLHFREALASVSEIKIPRYTMIVSAAVVEIHGFSDASNAAYGAVIYIRCILADGTIRLNMLCSKSKVCPMGEMSIPRKELLGARLLSRLIVKVLKSLQLEVKQVVLWCDSQVVLAWLQKPLSVLEVFVRNRVAEILKNTETYAWKYVKSKQNPADLISRGQFPKALSTNELWWTGPKYLSILEYQSETSEDIPENEIPDIKQTTVIVVPVINNEKLPIFSKFSSFRKLQRVLAFVQRFIRNCQLKSCTERVLKNHPTIQELRSASHLIVQIIQQDVFADEIQRMECCALEEGFKTPSYLLTASIRICSLNIQLPIKLSACIMKNTYISDQQHY
ncbi:uncharacterized protein LOC129773693 [Toxorhynchites rutilus septentrionalis]|uniref:uncharacterized protein LOC129773693 n=1 Tax=Toxorhynchites rutilus septentrionalis TaxID=329112 RepID=UPI002479BE2C|nr:uncharacterized protein LOC129773693 [Toxorhynchites rutilus septentrionalis]